MVCLPICPVYSLCLCLPSFLSPTWGIEVAYAVTVSQVRTCSTCPQPHCPADAKQVAYVVDKVKMVHSAHEGLTSDVQKLTAQVIQGGAFM